MSPAGPRVNLAVIRPPYETLAPLAPAVPLDAILKLAKDRNVPVIVDAAAQIPPSANLWAFTQMGADLVVFSGGKCLGGPQSSGLIVGKHRLVANSAAFIQRTGLHGREEAGSDPPPGWADNRVRT